MADVVRVFVPDVNFDSETQRFEKGVAVPLPSDLAREYVRKGLGRYGVETCWQNRR